MGGLIEGIGDEVLHFFIALTLIVVVTIAWSTTDIRNQWNLRVVYLLDRSGRIRASHTLSNHLESATISEGTDPGEVASNTPPLSVEPPDSSAEEDNEEQLEIDERINEIVEAMDASEQPPPPDAETSRIENVRVFRRVWEVTPTEDVAAPAEPMGDAPPEPQPSAPPQQEQPPPQQLDITIKLKYINDDLKIVTGRLGEMLGDFKRRHFEDELSSNKLVRLIFNGQVLQRDSDTLRSYGMFDNCVVHCLVYQQRVNRNGAGGDSLNADGNAEDGTPNANNNNNPRDWDLGCLFIAFVCCSLGAMWLLRYQYPQFFTVTATVGLVTITGVFTVLSISSYFPDQLLPLQENIAPQLNPIHP